MRQGIELCWQGVAIRGRSIALCGLGAALWGQGFAIYLRRPCASHGPGTGRSVPVEGNQSHRAQLPCPRCHQWHVVVANEFHFLHGAACFPSSAIHPRGHDGVRMRGRPVGVEGGKKKCPPLTTRCPGGPSEAGYVRGWISKIPLFALTGLPGTCTSSSPSGWIAECRPVRKAVAPEPCGASRAPMRQMTTGSGRSCRS